MTHPLTSVMTRDHTCVMTPNENHTPRRTVRVDDALWNSAQEMAEKNGDSVSEIVRNSLEKYVAADYLDKRSPRQIILATIEELASDLLGLRAAYTGDDLDASAIYADHPLWNMDRDHLILFEAWLRLQINERREHWGLPEDPENIMTFDED